MGLFELGASPAEEGDGTLGATEGCTGLAVVEEEEADCLRAATSFANCAWLSARL